MDFQNSKGSFLVAYSSECKKVLIKIRANNNIAIYELSPEQAKEWADNLEKNTGIYNMPEDISDDIRLRLLAAADCAAGG